MLLGPGDCAAEAGFAGVANIAKKIDLPGGKKSDILDNLHKRADVPDYEVKNYQSSLELKKQILVEEQVSVAKAAGIFDKNGILKSEIVTKAKEIKLSGGKILDQNVIKKLTADGSSIKDWGKFRTDPMVGPRERLDWHFYKNKVTGKINTETGYKPKPIGEQK